MGKRIRSHVDVLLFVVDLVVERVVVSNEGPGRERVRGLFVRGLRLHQLLVELGPSFVVALALVFVLLNFEALRLRVGHLDGLVEREGVYLLQDRLEGDQLLLQNLVPVVLRQVYDDGHKHGEGF